MSLHAAGWSCRSTTGAGVACWSITNLDVPEIVCTDCVEYDITLDANGDGDQRFEVTCVDPGDGCYEASVIANDTDGDTGECDCGTNWPGCTAQCLDQCADLADMTTNCGPLELPSGRDCSS